MKIFDAHTHAMAEKPQPELLLAEMEKAGVFGGCVFSNRPYHSYEDIGTSFDERMNEVLAWAKGYEDRIFPVMWIHPYEPNIIENIHKAVENGICAFKIICTDFYVYEEESLRVLSEIASLGVPVFFHSGILWDGRVSSSYNRPVNWEALINIKGLRFSMGHCSWPWIDECIALYGKFLNALLTGDTAEMFFDITPGTPDIYREELLTKLFTIGYDVGDNIMFGTDAYSSHYSADWSEKWLETDKKIMDKLGVSRENREKLYYKNLMRFLGKDDAAVSHNAPDTDNANAWSPVNPRVAEVAEKWYKKLGFPSRFDKEFRKALSETPVSDAVTVEDFKSGTEGKRNLITALWLCEELAEKYRQKGIAEEVLLDTLSDLVIWTETWSDIKGELYLGENEWLARHLGMRLVKLGRLQYCMAESEHDIEKYGIKKGDAVLEVHIPAVGPLSADECVSSLAAAKPFFAKYFPDFEYSVRTCHSWLLDPTLSEVLKEGSNILKFQELFDIVHTEKADDIIRYVFPWDTDRHNIRYRVADGSLAVAVKKRINAGGDFLCGLGVIKE
ncbi:MAG: amidohydrolase family protein [Clostridia bacterium]|nr:amidohydrolase family protein [Clostridia bacterium]